MKKKSTLKVMTVVGTRPEIIRLSRVMALLDEYVDHITVHTGQNYDYELNEIFYKDLGIRKPDYFLNADTSSLGSAVGDIIRKSGEILAKEKPSALVVLGDTNSCLSAYMAKRFKIPIYHMEAGNRCFDFNVPEEINRRIIDHIADFNLVYTERARLHLLSEGLPHRRIYLTGSPMFEVLDFYKDQIGESDILKRLRLKDQEYFVVSAHREENVDNKENLKSILTLLNQLANKYNKQIIVSTHPRTQKRLSMLREMKKDKRIRFLKPFGFHDYVHLQQHALCSISDSGTISEESAILNIPAVTIRNAMERPEAIDNGTIILTGLDPSTVLESIDLEIRERRNNIHVDIPAEYKINNTSWRVLKLIVGTNALSNKWQGIQSHE